MNSLARNAVSEPWPSTLATNGSRMDALESVCVAHGSRPLTLLCPLLRRRSMRRFVRTGASKILARESRQSTLGAAPEDFCTAQESATQRTVSAPPLSPPSGPDDRRPTGAESAPVGGGESPVCGTRVGGGQPAVAKGQIDAQTEDETQSCSEDTPGTDPSGSTSSSSRSSGTSSEPSPGDSDGSLSVCEPASGEDEVGACVGEMGLEADLDWEALDGLEDDLAEDLLLGVDWLDIPSS